MSERMTGYTLLVVGVAIIAFAAFSVYTVFTGRAEAFKLFTFEGVSIPLSSLMQTDSGAPLPTDVEIELLKADDMNETTNTFAHLLLMGFVSSIGFKLASLGVNMLRPIVVHVNDQRLKNSIIDPK